MNKKIFFFNLVLLFLFTGSLYASDWKSVETNGFTYRWRIVDEWLESELSYPTTGWIAVGYNPQRIMKGADIIIGAVQRNQVVIEDHFGTSLTAHKNDELLNGRNDLAAISGEEQNNTTTLRFKKPLNSQESTDNPLEEGAQVVLIFASSSRDQLTRMHNKRAKVIITL